MPVLADAAIAKVGHDLKADLIVLGRHGVRLHPLDFDTMLASYLLDANESSQALEPVALEQLGYKALTDEDVRGKGAKALPFAQVPVDGMLDYAGERADLALQLADHLAPLLARDGARARVSRARAAARADPRGARTRGRARGRPRAGRAVHAASIARCRT